MVHSPIVRSDLIVATITIGRRVKPSMASYKIASYSPRGTKDIYLMLAAPFGVKSFSGRAKAYCTWTTPGRIEGYVAAIMWSITATLSLPAVRGRHRDVDP